MSNFLKASLLGVTAGMRAAVAPALASHYLSRRASPDLGGLNFMRSPAAANAFKLAAVGELVGDKLPMTPNRIEIGPLSGRALSGALCGAALYGEARERKAVGAVIGGVAAVAGAYAFYHLRRALGEQGMPDVLTAVAEDALALAGGIKALE